MENELQNALKALFEEKLTNLQNQLDFKEEQLKAKDKELERMEDQIKQRNERLAVEVTSFKLLQNALEKVDLLVKETVEKNGELEESE